jgi:hypothetical protein
MPVLARQMDRRAGSLCKLLAGCMAWCPLQKTQIPAELASFHQGFWQEAHPTPTPPPLLRPQVSDLGVSE